jgi:hypothetical protein
MFRSPFPDVDIPDVPLTDFVLARAGGLGDKPALIDGLSGRTITYAQLAESVRAGAAGLAERGFGKGDIFAHYAPNLPEYAVASTRPRTRCSPLTSSRRSCGTAARVCW